MNRLEAMIIMFSIPAAVAPFIVARCLFVLNFDEKPLHPFQHALSFAPAGASGSFTYPATFILRSSTNLLGPGMKRKRRLTSCGCCCRTKALNRFGDASFDKAG